TNWKEIAAEVKTRNHVQCLQRWKKVLTPGLVKGQWTPEEDKLLVSIVNEGHKNWGSLSARVPGRTSKQCRERWCHHLDPRIVKGGWTEEEDQIIIFLQRQMGNKWAQIAQHLDGRTENATKIRWKILEREMKKEEERHEDKETSSRGALSRPKRPDARLRCLATQAATSALSKPPNSPSPVGVPKGFGAADAPKAASSITIGVPAAGKGGQKGGGNTSNSKEEIPGRRIQAPPASTAVDGGGCDKHAGRRAWLSEEDKRLKEAVEELGEKNWREVADHVRTRNHIQCQQRWKKALRPGLVKGAWGVEEDKKLVMLIGQGFNNWSELAANTGRTAKQCRERWCHHLDPSVRHSSWTPEEDALLLAVEARLGTKWAAIAREIPGRTEHAVKGSRLCTLSREKRLGKAGSQQGRRISKGPVPWEPAARPNVPN
ncbi:unnamed protein product, partial [Ectocarpus sp. 12 AP-2014]